MERESGLATRLEIWPGAKVILTANVDVSGGAANGAVGTVCECEEEKIKVRLAIEEIWIGRETRELSYGGVARTQFPLLLAYALTIHRAQGLTLDKVIVELGDLFCAGQAYVALSRVRRLQDLFIAEMPRQLEYLFAPKEMQVLLRQF